MKNIKLTKILAFFMAVLMILPMIPTMDLTVFAEGEEYDFSGDIGKKATFNTYFPVPVYHELPTNVTNPAFGNECYQLGYNDFMPPEPELTEDESSEDEFVPQSGTIDDVQAAMAKITMVIDDWYYNAEYDLLWYKVKIIKGDTIPKLEENPWVFHDYVKNPWGASLILGEKYDILQDATFVNRVGYFVKSTIRLYNTAFDVYEYMAPSTEVYVAYSFTYNDEWYYWLAGDGFNGGRFCIVKAEDVSFIHSSIINTKIKLKHSVSSVDLYIDPKADINDFITVDASVLSEVYKITEVVYSIQKNIIFYSFAPCEGIAWPDGIGSYTYISSDLVEETDEGIAFPIVDFTNAAPLFRWSSVRSSSAAYMARSSSVYGVSSYAARSAVSNATNGLGLSKIATSLGNGKYQIELEAYTTGTVTVSQVTKPMDIVLVIDQSGSMAYCIEHGTSMTSGDHKVYSEVSASDVKNNGEYYIKNGNNYQRVYYCSYSSSCQKWHTSYSFNNNNQHRNAQSYHPNNNTFYTATTTQCTRRYDALVDALDEFVAEVERKTHGDNGEIINHRIAIVGFSSDTYYNTELLTGVTLTTNSNTNLNDNNTKYYPKNMQYNGVQYGSITNGQYESALQDLSTADGYTNVTEAIGALTAHGGTQTLDGMNMAYEILSRNTLKNEDRDQVVILFTDGATNSDRGNLLNKAYDIKQDFEATIYTVGIFDGADGSPSITPSDINNDNHLMHAISSNYPEAQYKSSGYNRFSIGTPNPMLNTGVSYYLSASDADALKEIFKSISSTVSNAASELNQEATIRDIVTPQFVVPANASDVKVYSVAYTGSGDDWGTAVELNASQMVTINTADNTLSITGFDFKRNFVSENGRDKDDENKSGNFYGCKIRIVFTVTENPDFLGGSNALTNGVDSGVYDAGGNLAGRFPQPTVNVPLKAISTVAQDKNIYYGNTTDLTGILNLHVTASSSGKSLQELANGINNAYVQLKYTITINNQDVVYYTIPAGALWNAGTWTRVVNGVTEKIEMDKVKIDNDTPYGIICDMTDAGGSLDSQQANGSATIYVYYPTLYFKDSVQKYRDQLVNPDGTAYSDLNAFMMAHWDSVEWKHGTTVANPTIMEGAAPTLSLTFDYATGAFTDNKMNSTKDVPVNVTVKINGVVINDVATLHMTCSKDNCAYPISDEEFIVHVVGALTTLTIKKVGHNSADPNQTFLFNVVGKDADNNDINVTVTVHENGDVTIAGLIIGNTYSVTEIVSWSWRYNFKSWSFSDGTSGTNNGASITLGESGNVITFTNERPIDKWLDGDSWLVNLFKN